MSEPAVLVRTLGPLQVCVGGLPIALGGPRQRAVLALLAAHHPDVVAVDSILEQVWAAQAVERSSSNVQVYVSNLRRALRETQSVVGIETQPPGYRLLAPAKSIDWRLFDSRTDEGLELLGEGEPSRAEDRLASALALWRGRFLADVEHLEMNSRRDVYLEQRRLTAIEGRIEAAIAAGDPARAVAEAEALIQSHPLREQAWRLLILALHASGDKVGALRAFQRAGAKLRNEAGLEPGPLLREAEERVLSADAHDFVLGRQARLVALHDVLGLQPFDLDNSERSIWLLGRDAVCDIAIVADKLVSRRHAQIRYRNGQWTISDLDSTNGTWVNGQRIQAEWPLVTGSFIRVGSTLLAFRGPLQSESSWSVSPRTRSTEVD